MQPSYPPRGPGAFGHPVTTVRPHRYVKPNPVSAGVSICKNNSIQKVEGGTLLYQFLFVKSKGRLVDLELAFRC